MSTRPKGKSVLISALAAFFLVVAACGGDDSTAETASESGTDDATGTAALESQVEAQPTATPEPPPERPTIDELLNRTEPLNIAHAGGDLDGPHSTLFAFSEAVEAGADMLEIDVQLTGDGILVVQHDDTVDKTTDATGRVDALTYDELFALDNAYWFSPECWPCQDRAVEEYIYRGVRTGEVPPPDGYTADDFAVPRFRDLVARFPTMPIDIEIKGSAPEALPAAEVLAAEIEELGLTDHVVVVSFDDALLAAFEELAPEVETSPAVGEMSSWVLAGVPLDGNRIVQVPPSFDGVEVLNPAFWELAGEAGISVWVWPNDAATQENADFYRQLVADGATGVIAGRPGAMAEASS